MRSKDNPGYNGPDRREAEPSAGWHLDKKVPITLIVMLLVYGVTGLWAVADIKKDVELLKASSFEQHERDRRQDEQASGALALVRGQLERMETKMDRILEGRQK